MAVRLQLIDAFTSHPFAGNPAAVVLLEDNAWPAGQWLQQIAAEMNLHGAAFARRLANTTAASGSAGLAITPSTDGSMRASPRRYATAICHVRFD